jgi:hypothetical protein
MTEQGDLPAALIKGTALGFTPMELHTLLEDYETSKAKMWALSDLAEEGRYHEMYAQGKAWALTAEQVDDIVAPKGVWAGPPEPETTPTIDDLIRSEGVCFRFYWGKSGVLPHVELRCRQHLARDAIPTLRRILIPIAGDLALLGSPRGTLASTDHLDFLKVRKSTRSVHRRRIGTAELIG